jgi:hypothetical protein
MRAMTLALPVSAVGMLAVCLTLQTDVAQARGRGFGGFGISIGGGIAGAILGGVSRGGGGSGRSSSRRGGKSSRSHSDEDKPSKSSPPASNTAVASAASSEAVLKGFVVSKSLGNVGVEEEIDTARLDQGREQNRDYSTALKSLFTKIGINERNSTRDGSSSLAQGDVTQHAVDRSVAKAYEVANLATFEQFKDEQWTQERFRVAMLERAQAEVPGLLFGNNFRRVEMDTIDEMIGRAARSIYKRALETSELIAVNQATARFTRALYELYGPLENDNLRAGVEEMLLGANHSAFADYEERFVRSEYGVILRYRAERILNDCLTSNIEDIVSKKGEPLTKELMIDRVEELARGECRNWVVNALGDPKKPTSKEDDEKALKPLPVRAVWVSPGKPRTDASMFGRASGSF